MEENIFNSELGKKILALTKASFKVSDLISDQVFREKIKHQVLEVYKKFFSYSKEKNYIELLKEIEALDSLFHLARHLNFAQEDHVKSLRNGFLVFKSYIVLANHDASRYLNDFEKNDKIENSSVAPAFAKAMADKKTTESEEGLNERQEKIMKHFRDKKTVKFTELSKFFPHISEKTVRNDLSYLIEAGKLKRLEKGTYERK